MGRSAYEGVSDGQWAVFAQKVVEERDVARARLSNLLARIHRDGGHYEVQHGTAKAVVDADEIVVEDRQAYVSWRDTALATAEERDEARAEVERLKAALPCPFHSDGKHRCIGCGDIER